MSKEERVWLTKFFRDVMLEHSAIYTLWGSKPMTEIVLERHSQQEARSYYEALSREEKKKCWIVEDYDLLENWKRWQQIQHRFPSKRYLFFECEWRSSSDAVFVYFVDVLKTAMTITENYSLFHKVVGVDFDPTAVVFEMPNRASLFWNKVSESALLWGLLFGFGKENAYAFHCKYFEQGSIAHDFFEHLKHQCSEMRPYGLLKVELDNFEIPSFISFDEEDEVIYKYRAERKKIRKHYKNRPFLDLTLHRMMRH